ncbi:hypothetical protein ACM26V_03000 [Salipaludibacillus sp. HK11]
MQRGYLMVLVRKKTASEDLIQKQFFTAFFLNDTLKYIFGKLGGTLIN